jgi:hypothetical protein
MRGSVAGLLAFSCALGAWVACRDEVKQIEKAALPAPAAPPQTFPTPDPETLARMLEQAPHLNRQSAELLIGDARRHGVPIGDLGEDGLIMASAGFGRLPEEQARELGALFDQVYAPMPEASRAVVEAYLQRLRRGDAATTELDRRARDLLRAGISRLPDPSRQRLQVLIGVAIRETMTARRETTKERLMASSRSAPAVPEPPVWTPSTHYRMSDAPQSCARCSPSPDPDAEERRLRQRAESYKEQLESLEASVKAAEDQLEWARKGYEDARQTRMTAYLNDDGSRARDEAQRRIKTAEENVARARNAVVDLERKAYKEGILPGYLR